MASPKCLKSSSSVSSNITQIESTSLLEVFLGNFRGRPEDNDWPLIGHLEGILRRSEWIAWADFAFQSVSQVLNIYDSFRLNTKRDVHTLFRKRVAKGRRDGTQWLLAKCLGRFIPIDAKIDALGRQHDAHLLYRPSKKTEQYILRNSLEVKNFKEVAVGNIGSR